MTLVDYAVLAIVGFSVLLSVIRGFVREVLALAAWAVAAVAAWLCGGAAGAFLPAELPGEAVRAAGGTVVVFIAALLVMSLIAAAVSQLIKSAGLSMEDRLLGSVFGLARGLAVVLILALGAGLTALPQQAAWRDAVLRPVLERMALGIRDWLPPAVAQQLKYG